MKSNSLSVRGKRMTHPTRKKRKISWKQFCKEVSVMPEKYDRDTQELAAKLRVYIMLYGTKGLEGLKLFI